jgi:putative transposase
MLIAHRVALDPNNVQATYLARAAGVARFAYNRALSEWQRQYVARKADPALPAPSQLALRRQLNTIKREQYPWMLDVTKNAPQMAARRSAPGFSWARRSRTFSRIVHVTPGFAAKASTIVSRSRTTSFVWTASAFTSRRWAGCACAKRYALRATSSRRPFPAARTDGMSALPSTQPKHPRHQPKTKEWWGSISACRRWPRCRRENSGRRDGLHKLTTSVTRRFQTIGIEDLNVRGMLGNRCLARAIADMGFHELRRQLEYKVAWRGGHVVVANRWYPSSKTCSYCGQRLEELALGTRSWTCPTCGVHHDRDVNAAVSLKNMAMSSIASACGGNGPAPVREYGAKPVPVKQEPSSKS